MAPPISPSDLQRVLKALPPEAPDPFPHLADLNADQLIQRRVEVTGTIKTLEQERQVIDAELLSTFGDADLRFGCSCPWSLGSQAADSNQLGLRPRNQGCHEVSSTTGTGRTEGIAQERIHLYFSRRRGGVKESIESLIANAVAKNYAGSA